MFVQFATSLWHSILNHRFIRRATSIFLAVILLVTMLPTPVKAADGPSLITPVNGSIVTATGEDGSIAAPPQALPVFSWTPIGVASGTPSYRIQISTDSNLTGCELPRNIITCPVDEKTTQTSFIPTTVGNMTDGTYYWRVRLDSSVPVGAWSVISSFEKRWASPLNKPTLLSPAADATIQFFDPPVFSWTPVIGAAFYRFQISLVPTFQTTVVSKDTLTTSYHPDAGVAIPDAEYYWRVVPYGPAGTVSNPNVDYRKVVIDYDQVPSLIKPDNDSFPVFTPVFRWTAVRGAQKYRLQYSTDPTFQVGVTTVETRNTTYTLINTLQNDKDFYWRVQANNGTSDSSWSPVWHFVKGWYLPPTLLTPTRLFPNARFPFFSWTPITGAAKYRVVYCTNADMKTGCVPPATTENTFYSPVSYNGASQPIYWQVTAIDGSGFDGGSSPVGQFTSSQSNNTPDLVSPLYYYPPSPDMQPQEDRSAAYPLFTWSRVFDFPAGNVVPEAYRISVGTSVGPDGKVANIIWTKETENLSAAPTTANEFAWQAGVDYYWQVTPLNGLNGQQDGLFSQAWKVRFNSGKSLPATAGQKPQLLRPVYTATYNPVVNPGYDAEEFVEMTPALEWFPVANATKYQVEISRNSSFSPVLVSGEVTQPAFVPVDSFGQRNLNHLGYGSYYWRVKAYINNAWSNTYSDTWRFQIASSSQWQKTRTTGNAANRLEIARNLSPGVPAADFGLYRLYAAQDMGNWFFGFDYANTGTSTYVLYLDRDNRDNSGATVDKFGYPITTNFAHRPEYAIYIKKINGTVTAEQVEIYQWFWNGTQWGWDTGVTLAYITYPATDALYTAEPNYLEIRVPNEAVGMDIEHGTYSLALVSIDPNDGSVKAAVPENTITTGSANLDQFTTVSEHVTLAMPGSNLTGDPTTYPTTPPFFWNGMIGTPWAGWRGKIWRDAGFTTPANGGELTITQTGTASHYVPVSNAWSHDIDGDNTYYWRIRPRYMDVTESLGSWSQARRYNRVGFVPQNLGVDVLQATPTFHWTRVEGAAKYVLQYGTDSSFTIRTEITTTENSYISTGTLPNATYFWRVKTLRGNNESSAWTALQTFTLALPVPTGLSPNDPGWQDPPVVGSPTFCWDVLSVSNGNGEKVLYPWKYRLVVSLGDPNFASGNIVETIDTLQNCWTPVKGYADGTYYWKVAMIDGGNVVGAFSSTATFVKTYPTAKPLEPVSGSQTSKTPTFIWTANDGVSRYVYGAASYYVEISRFDTFTPTYDTVTTQNTVYIPTTKKYETDSTGAPMKLYWRVRIIDKDNKPGPWTSAWVVLDRNRVYLPTVVKR